MSARLVACGGSPGIADSRDVVNTWLALLDVFGSDESKRTQRAAKFAFANTSDELTHTT